MFSPYSIADHKQNIPQNTAERVQKDIIHIKASDSCKKLEYLHPEAEHETVKYRFQKAPAVARHGYKKSVWHKDQYISE